MREIEGPELVELTPDEWARIQRTLLRRIASRDPANIRGVAFGAKRRGGVTGVRPQLSARFHVRSKGTIPRSTARIPEQVRVRLRRGDHYVEVVLPTDVEEVGRIISTGSRVWSKPTASANETWLSRGTTGLVFRFVAKSLPDTWGYLTVGHPFRDSKTPIESKVSRRGAKSRDAEGAIYRRGSAASHLDAAFIEATQAAIRRGNHLVDNGGIHELLTLEMLSSLAARGEAGEILRRYPEGSAAMTLLDYSPEADVGPLGKLKCVLRAEATADNTFIEGTSGALWRVENRVAALQVAAVLPELRVGYGQAVIAIADAWLARYGFESYELKNSF